MEAEPKTETVPKEVEEKMADAESEDEDFAVDSQEMEEANDSSSESEGEDQEAAVDVEEEDFTVQVKGGEIQKMKFDNMHQEDAESQEEMSQEEESNLKLLTEEPLPENDDEEVDGDYNPLHDTLSDAEIDEDENESETPEISELKGKHKKTGLPLTEIKMNGDEMKIPPADFTAEPVSAEGMEE